MTLSNRTFVAMPDHPGDNGGNVLVLDPDAAGNNASELPLRLELRNHSPTGFAWGYAGSGPAQLSLALLAEVSQDDAMALDLYQAFKGDVISRKPSTTWSISEEYVRGWLEAMIARPLDLRSEPGVTEEADMPTEIVAGGEDLDPVLVLNLVRDGYSDLKLVGDRGVCGIIRFMYTVGVCYGMDATGREGRFCFDTMQNAQLFLKDWNGITEPTIGEDGCTAIK